MRVGCLGCLLLAMVLVGLGIIVVGGIVFATSVFTLPEKPPIADWTVSDGQRAQQKIFEILRRESRRSGRTEPIFLTERELNAFLARHLDETEGIPFSPLLVKLNRGVALIQGQTEFRSLLRGFPFNYLARLLPAGQLSRPIWVEIRGRVNLERALLQRDRAFMRFEPQEIRIGTQETGTWFLSWIVGPGLLRWPVPRAIEDIVIEEERLIVTTRSG